MADGIRIGVDFGDGCTVIAAGGTATDPRPLAFPGVSRAVPGTPGNDPVHVVPSLVTYRDGKMAWAGDAVLRNGAGELPETARWIRRYILDESPVRFPAGSGQTMGYSGAAEDFLVPLLSRSLGLYPGAIPVFALPPAVPLTYTDLLRRAARAAGAASCEFVEEEPAAAAGCGCTLVPGEPCLLIRFSGTGLEVTIFAAEDAPAGAPGTCVRTLARASSPVSCRETDTRIMKDLLRSFRLLESDPRAVRLAPEVRYEAERLREQVPFTGRAEVRLTDPGTARTFRASYSPEDLDRCLAEAGVIPSLLECTARALSALRLRGMAEDRICGVLLVGEGCALPAVQDAVRARFSGIPVYADHPRDAIARGAASFTSPGREGNRIGSSWALRYWDPGAQEHRYRFIVQSGTRYPSAGQVARIIISAAYDGQTHLGIPLCEIAGEADGGASRLELVSDPGGGMSLAGPAPEAGAGALIVHANERSPTLLVAAPPARKGEPRFECTFTIDPERNLCLSARDLVTGVLVKLNAPVYRLT